MYLINNTPDLNTTAPITKYSFPENLASSADP